MKEITIFTAILLAVFVFTNPSMAQQTHPTSKAKKAFQQKFPNAKNVSWGKETTSVFEAEFTLNGKHLSANFDKQGNWKETETPIPNSKIPNAVKRSYKKNHKMSDLKQAYKVAQPGKTVYELEVKMNKSSNTENGEQGEQAENEENENESSGIYELVYTSNGKTVNEPSESGESGEAMESGETGESGESGEQSTAQPLQPTNKTKKAFHKKFPNAQNVQWSKEEGTFEAEFNKNGNKMSAIFTAQGQWKETEKIISVSQLPDAIMQYSISIMETRHLSNRQNYGSPAVRCYMNWKSRELTENLFLRPMES